MIKMFHVKDEGIDSAYGFTKDKLYEVNDLGYGVTIVVDDNGNTRMSPSHFFTKQEEKQNIFTHPKWVTVKDDSLGRITKDKDYKVLEYFLDNYKILDDNGIECSLNKERFYKVTTEDLLPPKKKSVEHIDEGFDGLVVNKEALQEGSYIIKCNLTEDQRTYMQKVLPCYSERTFNATSWYNVIIDEGVFCSCDYHDEGMKYEISFNDIFKRV